MTQTETNTQAPTNRGGALDQRLARFLVRPLVKTPVSPNQLTTLRLFLGLAACALFAEGHAPWIHWGAALFMLSNFVDHMDGELARLSGKTTRFGQYYDIISDALIHVLLFVCIGYGLRESWLGAWAWPMGAISGIAVSGLFALFQTLEKRMGKKQAGLPTIGGFDVEDVMYLISPATWSGGLIVILIAATIGAPAFGLWAIVRYRRELFGRRRGGAGS